MSNCQTHTADVHKMLHKLPRVCAAGYVLVQGYGRKQVLRQKQKQQLMRIVCLVVQAHPKELLAFNFAYELHLD